MFTSSSSAVTSDTTMQTITSLEECKAAGGTCTDSDKCPIATNVFKDQCGETNEGCCIPTQTSGGGSGSGSGNGQGGGQGNGKGGGQGNGGGSGQGQGQGNGKGQGNGTGLARLSYLMPVVWGLVCSYRAIVYLTAFRVEFVWEHVIVYMSDIS